MPLTQPPFLESSEICFGTSIAFKGRGLLFGPWERITLKWLNLVGHNQHHCSCWKAMILCFCVYVCPCLGVSRRLYVLRKPSLDQATPTVSFWLCGVKYLISTPCVFVTAKLKGRLDIYWPLQERHKAQKWINYQFWTYNLKRDIDTLLRKPDDMGSFTQREPEMPKNLAVKVICMTLLFCHFYLWLWFVSCLHGIATCLKILFSV